MSEHVTQRRACGNDETAAHVEASDRSALARRTAAKDERVAAPCAGEQQRRGKLAARHRCDPHRLAKQCAQPRPARTPFVCERGGAVALDRVGM
jgi:hypothetical protein